MNKNSVISILGPTGVGKSELAFCLAEKIDGEIISSDSRQIYRWMDIGTDKPNQEKLKKIKHHCINILNPDEYYSAGEYAKNTRKIILEILKKGKVPIVVGGSGLYIRALFDGLFSEPVKDLILKNQLRKKAQEGKIEELFNELKKIDPEYAERVSLKDSQRIVRALEVYYTTGKKITEFWKEHQKREFLPVIFIGLMRKRTELYKRIEDRIDRMLKSGLIEETQKLLNMGYGKNLNSMQTIGYKEVIEYLDKKISYEEMVYLIKKKTRNYAKRQITWFKKDKRIDWFYMNRKCSYAELIDTIVHKYFI